MAARLIHDPATGQHGYRQALWKDFALYANFLASLDPNLPPFPVSPKKVALYLAHRVNLPCSPFLGYISPLDQGSRSVDVKQAAVSLQVIAQATSEFWTSDLFVGESAMVNEALE